MSQFIQLHLLTSYPPANLNRDDNGRPKTAQMGGTERLRVSSQSLKRHWRTSDVFQQRVAQENQGNRTKILGVELFKHFIKSGQVFEDALQWASDIADVFGKPESAINLKGKKEADKAKIEAKLKDKWGAWDNESLGIANYSLEQLNDLHKVEIAQLSFISKQEEQAAFEVADALIANKGYDYKVHLDLLENKTKAVDIAMFGRMLADSPAKNIEAACQVSHAISVHPVVIEDDYFTAVDDLNIHASDAGAAHIGETTFAAGLFYTYICINKTLLVDNLNGDTELAKGAIAALTEAAVKVSPTGKQNSFASRAYASYVLAESGEQQPRSLSAAFLKAVDGDDFETEAIRSLQQQYEHFDSVYEPCADARYVLNVSAKSGNLTELLAFVSE